MSKPTIVIMRTGSILYAGDSLDKAPPKGERSDTLGLIEYLADTGYRVVLFGVVKAKNWRKDIDVVTPSLNGIDEESTNREITRVYDEAVARLRAYEPQICINTVGACPSVSWVDNMMGAGVQAFAIRYVGPALYAMHALKLKRVCVVTDIRNYPKDQEMLYWPECRPVAVLSQEDIEFPRRIYDNEYTIVARYAGCENFWLHGSEPTSPDNERPYDCGIFAHTHLKDGRLRVGRDDAWSSLLNDFKPSYVHGLGWEHFSGYDPSVMLGLLESFNDMFEKLRQTKFGPMISMRPSFNSCKLGLYAYHGALPAPYGRGEPKTYDGAERYVSLDSELRVQTSDDMRRVSKMNESDRRRHVLELQEKVRPNFEVVERCIHDLSNDRDMNSDAWLKKYGGYRRL